jgi:hypothetical protein
MTAAELDAFLLEERTCRVATMSWRGPHNTPLWFAWDGAALWLYSIVRSRRWADLQRDPRVSVVVDAGVEYSELRGVELTGSVEVVGQAPQPIDHRDPALAEPERLFAAKYAGGTIARDGRHGWLRLASATIRSWDFRKVLAPGAPAGTYAAGAADRPT